MPDHKKPTEWKGLKCRASLMDSQDQKGHRRDDAMPGAWSELRKMVAPALSGSASVLPALQLCQGKGLVLVSASEMYSKNAVVSVLCWSGRPA